MFIQSRTISSGSPAEHVDFQHIGECVFAKSSGFSWIEKFLKIIFDSSAKKTKFTVPSAGRLAGGCSLKIDLCDKKYESLEYVPSGSVAGFVRTWLMENGESGFRELNNMQPN